MKRIVLLIFSSLVFISCGHEQSLLFIEAKQSETKVEETDVIKKMINAVERGDLEEVSQYLEEGVDVNSRNNEGLTLVMMAVRAKKFAVLELLMDNEPDLNLVVDIAENAQSVGKTVYDYISGDDDIRAILRAVIERQDVPSGALTKPLFVSIKERNGDDLRWFFLRGADPNVVRKKKTPLIALFSIRGIESEIDFADIRRLFEIIASQEGVDVNKKVRKNTPLKKAKRRARSNPMYDELVQRLVQLGAQ